MVRGRVGAGEVSPSAFSDPEILRLSDGMVFAESADYNAAFPARRFADVTLVLRDGRRLTSPRTEASGDPENPAPMEDVRAKFHANANPVLGRARADKIEQAVDDLAGTSIEALADAILSPTEGAAP
jgi:2-methylcitrate dehydratase PrpD